VRDLCRRYEAAGVDEVIFVMQAGKNRHEHICESIELFGAEVLPEFAERADAADAARIERHAGAMAAALARREPPRAADPTHVIASMDSGPPAAKVGAGAQVAEPVAVPNGSGAAAALRRRMEARGELAFRAFVRRSSDRRLERTLGSDAGLRMIFNEMGRQFVPENANGFAGDIQYDLRSAGGRERSWTVAIGPDRALARPGASADPKLVLRLGLADFLRIAGRDLDPGKALLTGRMDLRGDFSVAVRLGEMFGQPSPF
jgi:hypothetical protein